MYTFETVIVNFVLFSKFIQSLLILFSKKIVCKAYQCEDSSHLILIKRMYPNRRYWWGKGNKSYLLWNHYIHIKPNFTMLSSMHRPCDICLISSAKCKISHHCETNTCHILLESVVSWFQKGKDVQGFIMNGMTQEQSKQFFISLRSLALRLLYSFFINKVYNNNSWPNYK